MTTDGGKTWSPIELDLAGRERVGAVAAFSADGQTGLVGGNEGSVFMTTDGGKTWGTGCLRSRAWRASLRSEAQRGRPDWLGWGKGRLGVHDNRRWEDVEPD